MENFVKRGLAGSVPAVRFFWIAEDENQDGMGREVMAEEIKMPSSCA